MIQARQIGGNPAFAAGYTIAATSVAPNVFRRIPFNMVSFDTNGNFTSSATGALGGACKFQPTVPGKYLLTLTAGVDSLGNNKLVQALLIMNGSTADNAASVLDLNQARENFSLNGSGATSQVIASVTAIIPMNGTTDYVEPFVEHNDTGNNRNLSSNYTSVHFSGCWVAP